jgi:hypothetical protein
MTDAYFSEDDIYPRRSPGLEQVYVRAAPSPSPPPVVTKVFHPPIKHSSSRRPMKAKANKPNRRKTRPTQGDWVLIREMAPNLPEIAQQVSQQALNSDSDSYDSSPDEDDDMEGQSPCTVVTSAGSTATNVVLLGALPPGIPRLQDVLSQPTQLTATSNHRDSVVEPDIRSGTFVSDKRASEVSSVGSQANSHPDVHHNKPGAALSVPATWVINMSAPRKDSSVELAMSLHQLQIPQSDNIRLPSIQAPSPLNDASSPNSQQLPSISHMVGDIPRAASISEEVRANSLAHRQSISSLAQSPIARQRQMSMTSQTPASPFPAIGATSPSSATNDPFLRSSSHIFNSPHRRPSHASETGRVPPSASTSEGYQSSEGPSPGSQPSPIENRGRLMSIDGTLTSASAIILPVPNGSGIQQTGSQVIGTFRCEYSGCNALPFQTQYLLK